MKFFEDTTLWCKLELCLNNDEDFIENFDKIFNYYESEYNSEAEMKFYITLGEDDIWVEIKRESGMDEPYKVTVNDEEIDFEEYKSESILKAIKKHIKENLFKD